MANIGKNIKQIRIKNNMTQEALAEALFVTRQTVSNYETGKSNPDIDTIIKIAEIFKTDANAVIYGIPLEESKKRARIWAIATGALLIVLLIAYFVINNYLKRYNGFFSSPQSIPKFTLLPFILFVCGFFAMHIIGVFSALKPFNNKTAKIIRIILLVIIIFLCLGMLYFAAFNTVSFIKELQPGDDYLSFPRFFGRHLILYIIFEYKFTFTLLGALSWLFGLIYKV